MPAKAGAVDGQRPIPLLFSLSSAPPRVQKETGSRGAAERAEEREWIPAFAGITRGLGFTA
jgi:hypothetical protein